MTIAAAALVVCGILHIVGSERDTSLVLDDGSRRVALEGPVADKLVGTTWSRVCVSGARTTALTLGAAYSLRVEHARPAGDGKHAPIVGTLTRAGTRLSMLTDDGKVFWLRFPQGANVTALLGAHVWLTGTWEPGNISVARFGPF